MLLLLFLQAAAPAPDIQLDVHARIRSVRIEQKGETHLEVRAEPDGGSLVRTDVQPPANGATELRDVDVDVHAEARLADAPQNRGEGETDRPQ